MRKVEKFLFAISILILFSILFLLPMMQKKENTKTMETKDEMCANGTMKECYIGKCKGESICKDGEWTECTLNIICMPNSIKPCIVNYCARTYQVCNECGTGYSECLPLEYIQNRSATTAITATADNQSD